MGSKRSVVIGVRVPRELRGRLEQQAAGEGKRLTDVVRRALERADDQERSHDRK